MRKHEKKVKKEHVKKDETFILVDSPTWRDPRNLDIGSLRDILDIPNKLDPSANVFAYKFKDQDTDPEIPPGSHKLDKSLELAADDNYLYVWVKNRWKRIPLTEF
jgi:hypothetical protein